MIIVALVLGALTGLVYSLSLPREYVATARVMVVADAMADKPAGLVTTFLSQGRVRNYRSLLTSPALMQRSISFHGLATTPEYLEEHLTVTSPSETSLIDISVVGPTGQLAADYATAIATEFVAAASEVERQGAIHVRIVRQAEVPTTAFRPQTAKNIIDFGTAGAVSAIVFHFYRARRNPRLRELPGVAKIAGLPVAGTVRLRRGAMLSRRRSADQSTAAAGGAVTSAAERLARVCEREGRGRVHFSSEDGRLAAQIGELFADRVPVMQQTGANGAGAQGSADEDCLLVGVVSASSRLTRAERFAAGVAGKDDRAQMILVYK